MSGGGKSACGERLDVLGMTDFGAGVDYLLPSFKKLLGELSELKDFSFDERIAQSSYCAVDELLVWLSVLKYVLPKRGEWRLGPVVWSSLQFDGEDGVSLSHGEEGPGICVIQHESDVFGLATIVVSVSYGCRDTEPSIQSVLHERWSQMGEPWRIVDYFLVRASYGDRG